MVFMIKVMSFSLLLFFCLCGESLFGEIEQSNAYDIFIGESEHSFPTPVFIAVYRKYISSHDEAKCPFYPTCSSFCQRALAGYGFFWGILMTIDRMFYRENERSLIFYPYLKEKDRYFDPVYHNFIFNRSDYYR